jgi:hypothetical protein
MPRIITLLVALAVASMASSAALAQTEPLGLKKLDAPTTIGTWDQGWPDAVRMTNLERPVISYCRIQPVGCPTHGARVAADIINEAAVFTGVVSGWQQFNLLHSLNRRRIFFLQTSELWTAPVETFEAPVGNCKQLSLADALGAQELGYNTTRIVMGSSRRFNRRHAAAAVLLNFRWIMLDDSRIWDFVPGYVVGI